MRKNYNEAFKFKVALEALKGDRTIREISLSYEVSPSQVNRWKDHLRKCGKTLFTDMRTKPDQANKEQDRLYERIGKLSVEVDFLKKNLEML